MLLCRLKMFCLESIPHLLLMLLYRLQIFCPVSIPHLLLTLLYRLQIFCLECIPLFLLVLSYSLEIGCSSFLYYLVFIHNFKHSSICLAIFAHVVANCILYSSSFAFGVCGNSMTGSNSLKLLYCELW